MLEVNTKELEQEVDLLRQLIEDYERNYMLLFKELSDTSFNWKDDAYSKKFFNDLKFEKSTEIEYINSLKSTYKVYEYIKNKYEQIGSKIRFDINERDNILAKFNKCIDETNEIIVLYEHLDTSFCPGERGLINNQIKRLNNLRNKYSTTKDKVKSKMDKIIEIEKEIKRKISAYSIPRVKDFNTNQYLPEVTNNGK
ncbi:MAG: hypothetical protein II625_02535 [Bacilli bacterium]|nr:hypothetical protein [Bacilli bacterium]